MFRIFIYRLSIEHNQTNKMSKQLFHWTEFIVQMYIFRQRMYNINKIYKRKAFFETKHDYETALRNSGLTDELTYQESSHVMVSRVTSFWGTQLTQLTADAATYDLID